MSSLDLSKVPIVEKALHVPSLTEVADVLASGLLATFESVSAEVVECPDLSEAPYDLAAPGICGDAKLVEVGGPPYLLPLVQRDKVYELRELARLLRPKGAALVGAGAGPWPHVGVNCEGVVNLAVAPSGQVRQGSRAISVQPRGAEKGASAPLLHRLPPDETRSALLGNYLLSDGDRGQVIKVVAKKRIGDSNFITAIRETLHKHYGDKVVGLGGAFLVREGSVKHHVMPDFSKTPVESDEAVERWLHFFEYSAPLLHVGTLVTGEMGLDLRLQHFHGWGEGVGGHYHGDTTPRTAHYEAFFALAGAVLRLDAPPAADSHKLGRD